MTVDDLDFAVNITHQEGWGYNTEDLHRILRWSPEGCFVMWDDDRRIGMATTLFYGTFGWVGNVVIDKDHRGLGYGKAMTERCTTFVLDKGARGVRLFAYDNTRDFYTHLGFGHEGQVRVFRRSPATIEPPEPRSGFEVKVIEAQHLEAALGLDATAFTGDRKVLLRAVWEADPALCLGLWKDEQLRGALFGKKVLGNIEVGPWVCDLQDLGPAIDLMDTLLSMINCSVYTASYESQEIVIKALEERGFKQVDRVFCMSLGPVPRMKVENILAVGALEKG